jgi:hypothetical protein
VRLSPTSRGVTAKTKTSLLEGLPNGRIARENRHLGEGRPQQRTDDATDAARADQKHARAPSDLRPHRPSIGEKLACQHGTMYDLCPHRALPGSTKKAAMRRIKKLLERLRLPLPAFA